MKLNPDCVRDVMIALEDGLSVEREPDRFTFISMNTSNVANILNADGPVYTSNEIAYVLLQLEEDGYIVTTARTICDDNRRHFDPKDVVYLTPKGHSFVSKLRDGEGWEKTKKIAGAVGGISLSVIEAISSGIASAIIEKMV